MHALVDEVGDAVREHPGLAGAGAGDDEQRPAAVDDGVELVGVQPVGRRLGRRAIERRARAREGCIRHVAAILRRGARPAGSGADVGARQRTTATGQWAWAVTSSVGRADDQLDEAAAAARCR